MKVAAIQMVSGTERDANLAHARQALAQAAEQGAELAVLPEYFCLLGQRDTDKLAIQERFGHGPIQGMLAQAARELGLWVVGGTLPLSVSGQPERVRNSCLVYNPAGDCVARYDKMHLFGFDNGQERYDESRVLEAGNTPAWFDLSARDGQCWRVGLSVCYDLRFPELYRHLSQAGAQLLLVPSAFTHTTGQAHWEVLLRARAVENLCWVVASAQGGWHANGRRTWGRSLCVNPWGEVVAQQATDAGLVLADLDMDALLRWRNQLPA